MKKYPDISELIRMKEEWRRRQASRPIEEKIETVERLRRLSKEIPKLAPNKTKPAKASK
ncbi:MAG TPA: hypothetical protein VK619_17255 [Pyrinomonadaceae bacterium]|nr:hypothetical protein [Pyrinomonadaceae bacterium]